MTRWVILTLIIGFSSTLAAAEPTTQAEQQSIPWYRWLFLGERAKPIQAMPKTAASREPSAAKVPSKEETKRRLEDEQHNYLQRLQAISKIKEIAERKGDQAVLDSILKLEEQADEAYRKRIAAITGLGAPGDDIAADKNKLNSQSNTGTGTAERSTPRRRTTRGDE